VSNPTRPAQNLITVLTEPSNFQVRHSHCVQ